MTTRKNILGYNPRIGRLRQKDLKNKASQKNKHAKEVVVASKNKYLTQEAHTHLLPAFPSRVCHGG